MVLRQGRRPKPEASRVQASTHETRTGHGPCVGPKPGNTNGENRKPKTARSIAPSSLGSEVVEGGGASKAMLLSFVNYLVFAGSRAWGCAVRACVLSYKLGAGALLLFGAALALGKERGSGGRSRSRA